jgi:hypothetical protein
MSINENLLKKKPDIKEDIDKIIITVLNKV